MTETRMILDAMRRLTRIGQVRYEYDPAGVISGEGPMLYLVELADLLFTAWENQETGTIIVNPITRWDLFELVEELDGPCPWTVLRVPVELTEGIQFREVDAAVVEAVYHQMEGRTFAAYTLPAMQAH